jgi:transcriptional regulator with XRE-family HTH domain
VKIAEILKLYLAIKGVTIREFGKEIGISGSTVSRITNGGVMDLYTYLKLNSWLFGETNHPGIVRSKCQKN